MKLIEALRTLQPTPERTEPLRAFLACGCEPLHLKTFLAAHLQVLHHDRRIELEIGVYGDCLGNLQRAEKSRPDIAALVMEWSDLDPRLGIRQLGGWAPSAMSDILDSVNKRLTSFEEAAMRAAEVAPLSVCLPTLPLPPVPFTPPWQASAFELTLRDTLSSFAAKLVQQTGIRIVNAQHLDGRSPLAERRDVKSELHLGFPYRVPHAEAIAETIARLSRPSAPLKGLITDLDGTLWKDLVGEVGAKGVSWTLENRSQIHGLYQQMLVALSEAGVLIAVASKNDPEAVEETFQRQDLILPRDRIYPMEVHWGPKSESVGRILRAWNIAADAVVFVDDSAMELAEVKATHPGIESLVFPGHDEQAAYALLGRLRELFGKERLSVEDGLRLDSLRRSAVLHDEIAGSDSDQDAFLQGMDARLTLSLAKASVDPRALELINKTNQFNLNGRRLSESEWRSHLSEPNRFLLIASYQDKYGPLGKIAVLTGRSSNGTLFVDTWVMSCRAFARRIEHRCLEVLFDRFGGDEIVFDFQETPRNGPVQGLLAELTGRQPERGLRLSRDVFLGRCPRLFQTVTVE
jgi:FkbH-like protein